MTPDTPSLSLDSSAGSPAGAPLATPDQRKGVVWKWSIAITILVLAFLMWQCGSAFMAGRKLSTASVQQFHLELNGAEYAQIVDEADEGFRHKWNHKRRTNAFSSGRSHQAR
ncbi:MAG TPA: hypothetical protein VFM77_11450 [Terriglobales bacterium]|nr:hypothetical protein [Terriglobales bacterium]